MSFVRIIKVSEVRNFYSLKCAVEQRYPNARFQRDQQERTVVIVVPDLLWSQLSQGPEGFFRGLCQSGLIGGFHHKRYSDQEEVSF